MKRIEGCNTVLQDQLLGISPINCLQAIQGLLDFKPILNHVVDLRVNNFHCCFL